MTEHCATLHEVGEDFPAVLPDGWRLVGWYVRSGDGEPQTRTPVDDGFVVTPHEGEPRPFVLAEWVRP